MNIRTATICVCMWSGMAALAHNPADSLRRQLSFIKSDTHKVWVLRDIAYYIRTDYPDSAILYSRRGALLARSLHFPEGEIRNLYQTALAFEDKEQLDSAFHIYDIAIQGADRAGIGKSKVDMLNASGVAYYYAGNLSKAALQYALAFAAADSLGYTDQKGYALNNMGVIYRMQGRYDKAVEAYRKSMNLKKTLGDTTGVVNALYNMGLAHSYTERYEESLDALLQARELAKHMDGRDVDLAQIEVGLGVAYYNLGRKNIARDYLLSGLKGLDHTEAHTFAAGMGYLGAINVDQGRHEEGMREIETAYTYAKSAGRLELLLQILRELATAAHKVDDPVLAAKSWREYSLLADSLRNRDLGLLREEMQARFELKDKDITIAGQQGLIEQELLRSRRMQITALVMLLLALACGVLAIQLRRRAVQLKKAVVAKVKVLEQNELLLKEMHHRTKNNLQLLQSVFNLHRRATVNEGAREVLRAGSESVEAIGLLHHHLYRSGNFRKVNIKPYLEDLVAFFKTAFHVEQRHITLRLTCPDLEVDIDVAVPLGIVINELCTNSLKYAFETGHEDAQIELEVSIHGHRLSIRIADNGHGNGDDPRNPGTGSRLVDLFGQKLGAVLTRQRDEGGTAVKMEFEIPEKP